jgi:hypothetical protein
MFSYRIHDAVVNTTSGESLSSQSPLAKSFAVPSGSRQYSEQGLPSGPIHQGRHNIMSALQSFGPQKFLENVDYDVYWLGNEEGVLVACHGEVEGSEGALSVEQSWVLKRKEIDKYVHG